MTKEQIFILVAVSIFILIITILVAILLKKKKKKEPSLGIDSDYVAKIMDLLGGNDNVTDIDVIDTKLKISVKNLKAVNLEGLKELTLSGIFVTGNTIKILFKYESQALRTELNRYKGV